MIVHIDFNSYFASIEQQANPHLRGKPLGVTGGDRMERTVIGAASVEAKRFGVKTGMQIWQAKILCPQIILVPGDSHKYLSTTKQFLNILKDYGSGLEVFSIDECFLETQSQDPFEMAVEIKQRIKKDIGEYAKVSVGISYNKVIAKLASSLYKPDGLVMIGDPQAAQMILDQLDLSDICGIGSRIKKRLNNMGIFNFKSLRKLPLGSLLVSFKSYGGFLYDISRGLNYSQVIPFFQREEIKSVGHRHTLAADTSDPALIRQTLLKLTELVARRLRSKNLLGKTVTCFFRYSDFSHSGMQATQAPTDDGLEIFNLSWKVFSRTWSGAPVRMLGCSVSNLISATPINLSLLDDMTRRQRIIKALDRINDRFGEFSVQRGSLLGSAKLYRKPNPYLSDRRFKMEGDG